MANQRKFNANAMKWILELKSKPNENKIIMKSKMHEMK